MSGLREEYGINDIYIVKFVENYRDYLNNNKEFSEVTLNTNLYYIVEKFSYENKIHALYADSYKECVGGLEFYEHRSHTKIEEMPPIFSEMYTFPEELLTEDEKNKKMISSNRLYYISLNMNIEFLKDKENENSFVKKLKRD